MSASYPIPIRRDSLEVHDGCNAYYLYGRSMDNREICVACLGADGTPSLAKNVTAAAIGMDSSPAEVAQDARLWGPDSIAFPAGTAVTILNDCGDFLEVQAEPSGIQFYIPIDGVTYTPKAADYTDADSQAAYGFRLVDNRVADILAFRVHMQTAQLLALPWLRTAKRHTL